MTKFTCHFHYFTIRNVQKKIIKQKYVDCLILLHYSETSDFI